MTNTKYQVLARRYRPKTFSEVVGQEPVVTTLKNALRFDKRPYNVLELEEAPCVSGAIAHSPLAYAVDT